MQREQNVQTILFLHQLCRKEGKRSNIDLSVFVFEVDPVALLAVNFCSSVTFSIRVKDTTALVANVVPGTLKIKTGALIDFDEMASPSCELA